MASPFFEQLVQAQDRLNEILNYFATAKVLVIGDLTLDEFLTGQVERISREAPVLILRHEDTRQIPGGGANAVYNLAKLGAKVKVVGLVGSDIQGEALRRIFNEVGIDTNGILIDRDRPTVTKTRIAGHARQSVTQQIVRVDRKSDDWPILELQQELARYIEQHREGADALVCSDYGDGVFSEAVIQAALNHQAVYVDSQQDLFRFPKATLFTPNLPEAELAVGYKIKDAQTLAQAGEDLLNQTQATRMLITRGESGMSLFERGETGIQSWHIPAFNRTEVFDVTGAGDTVVAALTLALCAGATFWEAAVLGNLAASIVVRQFGTATTSIQEMQDYLQMLIEEGIE